MDLALAADDAYAGIDRTGAGIGDIDGHGVTGCLGVDFGDVLPLGTVTLRARAVGNACAFGCGRGRCGTGRNLLVFAGAELGAYTFVAELWATDEPRDLAAQLPRPVRYVVACRSDKSPHRDDFEIDHITSAGGGCGAAR